MNKKKAEKRMKMEDVLNEEIVLGILDRLGDDDDQWSVKSLSQTCRCFYEAESKHRRSARLLRAELLPGLLRRYRWLSRLDLSLLPGRGPDDSLLRTVSASALSQSLRSLKMAVGGGGNADADVSQQGMSHLLSSCANLEELDLSNSTGLTDSAAAAIGGARSLRRLSLQRCKLVSDMALACIAVGCSQSLASLNLRWCLRVSDMGVALLALKCTRLLSLDLSFVPITEKCLGPVLELPNLQDLVLLGCLGLDDDGLASLHPHQQQQQIPSPTNPFFKTLDLSNCHNIGHIGLFGLTRGAPNLQHLTLSHASSVTADVAKCLQNLSMLRFLKLDGCTVTTSALKIIGDWSASLRELSLSKCSGVTDEGIASLVRKHTQLTKLDITCCRKITSLSIHSITASCTSLSSLKMEACSLVSREAFALIGKHSSLLQDLDVTDNSLDDQGLTSISRCSRLTSLKLGVCLNISDEGLVHLGNSCWRLKEIDLYRAMRITDAGIAAIAQGCADHLELINVAYCDKVTDASLVSLSKCARLRALEMRGCPRITSEGLAAVAAGCRQLTILDIKKCHRVDNAAMIPLARYSRNLKQINLSYCSVTDVGLLALASISRLQNMTILHLAGLSPNGLAAALLACGGLRKVKLHSSFKALLPPSLISHMESRGCVFHWRDKAFQPQVDIDADEWNLLGV